LTISTAEAGHRRCRCPRCLTEAALTLLRTGRPGMAALLLEDLPEALDVALEQAFQAGKAEATGRRGPARAGRRAAR
jgi:hypothetical protein